MTSSGNSGARGHAGDRGNFRQLALVRASASAGSPSGWARPRARRHLPVAARPGAVGVRRDGRRSPAAQTLGVRRRPVLGPGAQDRASAVLPDFDDALHPGPWQLGDSSLDGVDGEDRAPVPVHPPSSTRARVLMPSGVAAHPADGRTPSAGWSAAVPSRAASRRATSPSGGGAGSTRGATRTSQASARSPARPMRSHSTAAARSRCPSDSLGDVHLGRRHPDHSDRATAMAATGSWCTVRTCTRPSATPSALRQARGQAFPMSASDSVAVRRIRFVLPCPASSSRACRWLSARLCATRSCSQSDQDPTSAAS